MSLGQIVDARLSRGYLDHEPTIPDLEATASVRAYYDRLSALTDGELTRYHEALFGPGSNGDQPDDSDVLASPAEYGCYGEALEVAYRELPALQVETLPFQYSDLLSRIEADRRYVEANNAWRDCMLSHGYDFNSFTDPLRLYFRSGDEAESPPPDELALAAADIHCYVEEMHHARRLVEQDALQEVVTRFPDLAQFFRFAVESGGG